MKSKHTHPLSTDTHSNTHATLRVALTSLNLCTNSHEDGVDYYAPLLPDDLLEAVLSFVVSSTRKQRLCQSVTYSTPCSAIS